MLRFRASSDDPVSLASEWSAFEQKAYWLELKKILELPLTEVHAKKETPTTVGAILKRVEGAQVEVEDCTLETTVATEADKLTVKGPDFNRRMLEVLLTLRNEGISPFSTDWFWYERDWNKAVVQRNKEDHSSE